MADRALGCLLGVAVGDAAGAPLEVFEHSKPEARRTFTSESALQAMRMPGKPKGGLGVKKALRPGQVTDDTELTICLAQGLAGHLPAAGFPAESVAQQYSYWFKQGAFCGGRTCKKAFSVGGGAKGQEAGPRSPEELAQQMQAVAQAECTGSKANGALMRAAPLGVWAHRLDAPAVAKLAQADADLSHPNPTCRDCNAVYCIAIAHLVAHPGDAQGALEAACTWAEQHAVPEVQSWLHDSDTLKLEDINCLEQLGYVRHAFVLAFYHLRRRTPFVDAVCQTLCRGGDTDTNACIVGGLMGALHGAAAIPDWAVQPVLKPEPEEGQGDQKWCKRPADLHAMQLLHLAQQLYEAGA